MRCFFKFNLRCTWSRDSAISSWNSNLKGFLFSPLPLPGKSWASWEDPGQCESGWGLVALPSWESLYKLRRMWEISILKQQDVFIYSRSIFLAPDRGIQQSHVRLAQGKKMSSQLQFPQKITICSPSLERVKLFTDAFLSNPIQLKNLVFGDIFNVCRPVRSTSFDRFFR